MCLLGREGQRSSSISEDLRVLRLKSERTVTQFTTELKKKMKGSWRGRQVAGQQSRVVGLELMVSLVLLMLNLMH